MAMNPTLKMPFKRYEMGPVFRDGPIKAGRLRQFWQGDVDTIGTSSLLADAELVSILQTIFNKLKLGVIIKVNNRKLLNGILEQAGIKKKEEAIIAIDKLDKIGVKGVSQELKGRGFKPKQIKTVFELVKENISLRQLKTMLKTEDGQAGIKELEELFKYLRMMGVNKAVFDVSLARGLAYYTGTVYEIFSKQGKVTSSLGAGGRYDEMIGKFGNREVPAVGVSFGLVPIMELMKEDLEKKTAAQVYIIPIKTVKESLEIVQQLRDAKINCGFDLTGKGISKNLQYAATLGIPYVLFVGERELKAGKVKLRDMVTGDEWLLSVKKVVEKLK